MTAVLQPVARQVAEVQQEALRNTQRHLGASSPHVAVSAACHGSDAHAVPAFQRSNQRLLIRSSVTRTSCDSLFIVFFFKNVQQFT
jgi:hypothetical protein